MILAGAKQFTSCTSTSMRKVLCGYLRHAKYTHLRLLHLSHVEFFAESLASS